MCRVRRPKPAGGAGTLITTRPPSQAGLKNVLRLVCVRNYSKWRSVFFSFLKPTELFDSTIFRDFLVFVYRPIIP